MTFAPPVSRDNFFYNGDLYIEVANSNRHKRAPISEITTILRPDLKKANKNLPADQVGHWYEAQLMHYGLPPSKDKARAKMRLLEALNQKKLVVPEEIVKMEAEMKKEYEKAERKARKEHKASQQVVGGKSESPTKKSGTPKVGKKRKNDEVSSPAEKAKPKGTKVAKKTEESGPSKPAKRIKKDIGPSNPNGTSVVETSHPLTGETIYKRPAQTAKSAKLSAIYHANPGMCPRPVKPGSFKYSLTPLGPFNMFEEDLLQPKDMRVKNLEEQLAAVKKPAAKKDSKVKQEAKNEETSSKAKKSSVKKGPSRKEEAGFKKEPSVNSKVKTEKKAPVKRQASVEKETKPKKESITTPSSQLKSENQINWIPIPHPRPLGLINGLYDISCPTVEREWSCTDLSLTLTLNDTSVWGAYDLSMFSGILFLPHRPWEVTNRPLRFTWRGRENSEGEMSFGASCVGEMTFLGDGNIEGWISVYGRCEFSGVRRPEAGTAVRTCRSMRDEWEGFNQNAYDYESSARWH